MNEAEARRVRGPQDLASSIAPGRDLWPGIAAAIAAAPRDTLPSGSAPGPEPEPAAAPRPGAAVSALRVAPRHRRPAAWTYALGLAATVACLAVGIWIGRASAPAARAAVAGAAFAPDARFGRERQALLVQARLGMTRLAPEDRAKVEASLATIRRAIADIRAALGDDPGNQLLQEMLVNSYQDEIRVLTAVKEAGGPGQEI